MFVIHSILNILVPPLCLPLLLCILPPYLLFNILHFVMRSMLSENVAGKVILITGASSGIGEHLAYEYGRRGARLALVARRENTLEEVASRAKSLGSPAGWLPAPRMMFYNASKAAVFSLYENLKTELGNDIGITIES